MRAVMINSLPRLNNLNVKLSPILIKSLKQLCPLWQNCSCYTSLIFNSKVGINRAKNQSGLDHPPAYEIEIFVTINRGFSLSRLICIGRGPACVPCEVQLKPRLKCCAFSMDKQYYFIVENFLGVQFPRFPRISPNHEN